MRKIERNVAKTRVEGEELILTLYWRAEIFSPLLAAVCTLIFSGLPDPQLSRYSLSSLDT